MDRKRIYTAISISLGILFIATIWVLLTGSGLENHEGKTLDDKKYAQMGLWAGKSVRLDYQSENRIRSQKENVDEKSDNQKSNNPQDNELKSLIEAEKRQRRGTIGQATNNSKGNVGQPSNRGNGGQEGDKPGSDSNSPISDKSPKITTNIKAGKVYPEAYATFYVEAEDYRGVNILWPGKYRVTLNGKELDGSVRYNYKDEDVGRNYQTGLNQGENLIRISVVDSKGNSITQEYTVYGDKDLAPDKYEQINAFVSVNFNNLGLSGIERTKLTVRSGVSAQKFIYDFLASKGYVVNGGDLENPYLASLAMPGITKGWSFSEKQKAYLSKYGDISAITLNPNYLGEKDTTPGSGYMWRLNGYSQPPYGMGSYSLIDGDVIEIWWTNDNGSDYESY